MAFGEGKEVLFIEFLKNAPHMNGKIFTVICENKTQDKNMSEVCGGWH